MEFIEDMIYIKGQVKYLIESLIKNNNIKELIIVKYTVVSISYISFVNQVNTLVVNLKNRLTTDF
jgi:hypothetical protein